MIAGDDRQLPPIVQAEYPAPEEPGPPLHRSILECLREGDPEDLLTRPLLENFRMCDRLCEYPRLSIYPEQYGPASAEIAERRLSLAPSGDPLLDLLLDPDYPVTMCVLEDVKATSRNPVEADLAARSVVALRDGLGVADDDDFAGRALFVVSPHHAQIRLLRRALYGLRRWDPLPLVDTVDKIQGQERDAVVISYGVSDVETALNEAKFIFSLNRLNVAVTRAALQEPALPAPPATRAAHPGARRRRGGQGRRLHAGPLPLVPQPERPGGVSIQREPGDGLPGVTGAHAAKRVWLQPRGHSQASRRRPALCDPQVVLRCPTRLACQACET